LPREWIHIQDLYLRIAVGVVFYAAIPWVILFIGRRLA
jgi:hypothetical protein